MQSRRVLYAVVPCFLVTALFFVGCGGGSSQSAPVQSVIRFSTQPSTSANEADLYTYTPTATDTANGTISFTVAQAPNGATLSGNTVNWTPTSAQSRMANSFTITATSTAGGSARQTWTVTPTGVIHGQQIVTWHKPDGTMVDIPSDLSGVPINVVVATASGFTTIPGGGGADGTFAVAKVPGGPYFLLFYDEVFSLSKSSVDLSFDRSGRPDVSVATLLNRHYQMGALDPWQSTDDITLYSQDLDTLVSQLGATLNPGDTTMDVTTQYSGNMLDASKGDSAYLTQMVANNFNGVSVKLLSKIYSISGVTETDGQTTTIGGPAEIFTDVPTSAHIEANAAGLSFAGMRPLINPNGVAVESGFYVDVLPFGTSRGWFGTTPDLVLYLGPPLNQDEDDGQLDFGDPFDSTWPLALAFVDFTRVTYNVPGVGPVNKHGHMFVYSTTMPTTTSAIAPITAPVRTPEIDGHDFFADQALNDLTPTISWTAPTPGAASEYIIRICKWQLSSAGDFACGLQGYATQVARVHTKATSVQIPPGILESGSNYFLTITSRVQTGVDLESAPYASAFPYGEAQTLSGMITVAASGKARSRVQSRALSPRVRDRIVPPPVNVRFHHL